MVDSFNFHHLTCTVLRHADRCAVLCYHLNVQGLKNDYDRYKPLLWRIETENITSQVSWRLLLPSLPPSLPPSLLPPFFPSTLSLHAFLPSVSLNSTLTRLRDILQEVCTSHAHHMHITCTSHAHHMYIKCTCIHVSVSQHPRIWLHV